MDSDTYRREDAHRRAVEDYLDEVAWQRIIRKQCVLRALRRRATEARRQYEAGEIEGGGFGCEEEA